MPLTNSFHSKQSRKNRTLGTEVELSFEPHFPHTQKETILVAVKLIFAALRGCHENVLYQRHWVGPGQSKQISCL